MPKTGNWKYPAAADSSTAIYPLTVPMLSVWFLFIGISCIRTIQTAITKVRDRAARKVYKMQISKERKRFLKHELKEYEKITPMTKEERRELHEWVEAGHSVHENTCCAVEDGNRPIDFLDIYREEEALRKATAGMESNEARKYVLDYYGWTEEETEKEEYTVETLKDRVRELERERFYLEEFIGKKGFWKEAQKYIEECRGEPIPFEIE